MKTIQKMLPGCLMALAIAAVAKLLENLEQAAGVHFIGASVIALFIGMFINSFYKQNAVTAPGIKFTYKKLMMVSIVLLVYIINI